MPAYRARDLLNPPTQISLSRVPLAILFPFLVHRPLAATAVLLLAGASDVVDGLWARRANLVTAMGTVVDPITDKLFVTTVVITLGVVKKLELFDVVLLSTRESGELPLILWLVLSARARRTRKEQPTALPLGKAATAVQFATVVAALWGLRATDALLYTAALLGALAAVVYWRRMLRSLPDG